MPESDPRDDSATAELPRYLQLLWGREAPGRRGPRPGMRIEALGEAAVAIADESGLDAVSMKAVADRLGTSSMALYRYVDSKEQLLAVMVDVGFGPPPEGLTAHGGWRERLERWGRAIADLGVAHPWITTVALQDPPSTPNALAWTDAGLRAFAPTELPILERLSSLLVIDGWVRSHVRMSLQYGRLGGRDEDPTPYGSSVGELLDPERFPELRRALPALDDDDTTFFEDELRFGLRLLLDGISVRVEAAAQRTATDDSSAG